MKLVRYRDKGKETYGALVNDREVVCLPILAKHLEKRVPKRLEGLVASGAKAIEHAENLLERIAENAIRKFSSPVNQVTLLAPIEFPRKIICLGRNYKDHAAEASSAPPDEPIIFMKPHTSIIGPNETIIKPSFVKQLDYEAELAIVMGRKTKNVPVSDAKSYIFGYTILNDVSARDIQFKDKQWTRGKGFDTFAPTGPCITASNQLQEPSNLSIRTWVNNELRQNSTTKNMVFNVYEIVHHLSRVMTLEPCDIIATGTPAGVGYFMKPEPKFLQAGDVVKIEVEKIGVLENSVVEE